MRSLKTHNVLQGVLVTKTYKADLFYPREGRKALHTIARLVTQGPLVGLWWRIRPLYDPTLKSRDGEGLNHNYAPITKKPRGWVLGQIRKVGAWLEVEAIGERDAEELLDLLYKAITK